VSVLFRVRGVQEPSQSQAVQEPPQSQATSRTQERAGAEWTNSIDMTFVLIPKGDFQMGSRYGDSDEQPVHRVSITRPFYLGKYEVR